MNDEGERLNLINRNGDGGSATSADHVPSATDDKDVIHPMGSFIVMFGFSLGTGILLISYSLRQLGLIPWFCALTVIILLQFMATHMINVCTRQMIEERGCSTIRDPYQATAELAGGRILRQFSLILMYTTNFIIAVSLFLLSASTITTFIPIRAISHAHNIRVWVSIVIAVLTPVTFLGTYSDLKIPSIIAVTTALISATAVVINCILKLYIYPNNTKQVVYVKESAFLPLGSLIFMTAGASITVSNLTVLTPAPRKLLNPIAATYILIFLIYMIVGPVPYYTFHENVMSSILATMSAVNNGAGDSDVGVFRVITILVQVLMLIHLTMASILAVNPIQLLLEDSLNIPQGKSFILKQGY